MNFLFFRADAGVNETRTSCFDCYNCIRTVNVSGMVTIHCVVHVPRCMIQVYSATSQEPKLRISYLLQRSPILNGEWKTYERIIVNAGRRNLCEVNYIPTSPHPTQMSFSQGLGTGISPLYSLAQFYHGAYMHMEEPVIHQESFMLQVQR